MQPCDAVKLIFQNEFGGGHLITDREHSLTYLACEYGSIPQEKNMPLYEDIGNGIVRVNIASIDAHNLSIRELNEMFVLSSGTITGSKGSFIQKLRVLEEETGRGIFRFSLPGDPKEFSARVKRGYYLLPFRLSIYTSCQKLRPL
jgi:hypothetical protein